jgi:hypothetical protein
MATFIKDVHDLCNFLAGKNIATKQPPENIDLVVYEVITELFNTYYDNYPKNQKIEDYLNPFKRKKAITITLNKGNLPEDYLHCRAIRTLADVKVDLVPDKFWNDRKNSKVNPPSATNVIARIEIQEGADPPTPVLEVYPSQNVVMEYFKAPTRPVYVYTKVGNRYVYDEDNTVDIEFSPALFNDIKKRVLAAMGVNLRDRELTVYSEQARATDQQK